ncbi:hypothetical protein HAX54_039825 [Datura stramonium]|uniref:Uncharacterized protein n=1 Tax=Datura stramonium TaxID=4076 RepID=A0ABS8VP82_DATST|nr:hypothetical protein [Datura stramonium]
MELGSSISSLVSRLGLEFLVRVVSDLALRARVTGLGSGSDLANQGSRSSPKSRLRDLKSGFDPGSRILGPELKPRIGSRVLGPKTRLRVKSESRIRIEFVVES